METKDSVSVIIGIKDRYDHRIVNALKSLRTQTFDQNKLDIILVDYGSRAAHRAAFDLICKEYRLNGIWTDAKGLWNKSKCLNIGIRRSNSEYILISDVDIIFQNDYINICVETAKKMSDTSLFSKMRDLQKGVADREVDLPNEYDALFSKTKARKPFLALFNHFKYGSSIIFARRELFLNIGGYDEFYELWGSEDEDLVRRLEKMSIKILDLKGKSSHMHQWHPKYENFLDYPEFRKKIRINRKYMLSQKDVVRNPNGWGDYSIVS